MKIGELASATGLSRDTLRFYEKRGLLLSRRRDNGYRDYPPEAVQWLCYLRSAQQLGFTLAEIEARGGMPYAAVGICYKAMSACYAPAALESQAPRHGRKNHHRRTL